jgi:hypothetical protein
MSFADMDSEEDDVSSRVIEDGSPTLNVAASQSKASSSKSTAHADEKSGRKASEPEPAPEMLHTGGVLGDLPALSSPTKSPNKYDEYTASGNCAYPGCASLCVSFS